MGSSAAPRTSIAGAHIQGEQSPAKLRRVDVPSQHWFRGARRHAARLLQEERIQELQSEVQRLEKSARVEARYEVIEVPVEKIVEKVVEIPVEKLVEAVGEPACDLQKEVAKAFELGTQLATKAKEELAEEMMKKMHTIMEDKKELEAELKDCKDRECKMKMLLTKTLAQVKEGKTERVVEKVVEVPQIVEKVIEVTKIVEKIIEVPKIAEPTEEEKLQQRISELMECEVPQVIAREVMKRCCKPGVEMNEEDLVALYDCGVFDELRQIEHIFTKRLRKALGEVVSASGSEEEDEEDSETTSNELDFNESFRMFEQEEYDEHNELEGHKSFQQFERENG